MEDIFKILAVTLNTGLLAVFYTIFGGILSYVLHYIFDQHDDTWEAQPTWYQVSTVSVEVAIISVIGLWVSVLTKYAPPIFHVSKYWDRLSDSYVAGVFFAFAMFLFLNDLSTKIRHLYYKLLDPHFERMFPLRKMDKTKKRDMIHQDGV